VWRNKLGSTSVPRDSLTFPPFPQPVPSDSARVRVSFGLGCVVCGLKDMWQASRAYRLRSQWSQSALHLLYWKWVVELGFWEMCVVAQFSGYISLCRALALTSAFHLNWFLALRYLSVCGCLRMFRNAACYSNSFALTFILVDSIASMPLSIL
jgi:hypothetical protein